MSNNNSVFKNSIGTFSIRLFQEIKKTWKNCCKEFNKSLHFLVIEKKINANSSAI